MQVTLDRFKKAFGKEIGDALLEERKRKCKEALRNLKLAVDALAAIGADPEPHKSALFGLAVQFRNIEKLPVGNTTVYNDLEEVKTEARNKAELARAAASGAPEADNPEKQLLVRQKCGEKPSEIRTALETARETDPDILKKVAALPGGGDVLDALVEDLGGKANSASKREFVKQAMLARFNMKSVEGDLTKKSLPHLYNVLNMVPDSHTRANWRLDKIELKVGNGGGDYTGGKLALNCLYDAGDRFWPNEFEPDPEDGLDPAWAADGDAHSRFDEVTLHEMGHAVDDKMKFMDHRSGNDDFGGWVKTTSMGLADTVGQRMGFFDRWDDKYSQQMLTWFLSACLDGAPKKDYWESMKSRADEAPDRQVLLDDAGIKAAEKKRAELAAVDPWDVEAATEAINGLTFQCKLKGMERQLGKEVMNLILVDQLPVAAAVDRRLAELADVGDVPDEGDWDEMLTHEAVAWCKLVRAEDAWKLGRAHANKAAAMDGNVYTHDKSGWYKYSLAARKKSISKYQFNTPAEWFAELYAAYYLKKLKPAHPDYRWMLDKVHRYTG